MRQNGIIQINKTTQIKNFKLNNSLTERYTRVFTLADR